jgi:tetratricopeptide (TPR) repeat protein
MERASLSVIKRDLRRAGLPESTRLVWRIARYDRTPYAPDCPIINTTGLGLPYWVSQDTLGMMGKLESYTSRGLQASMPREVETTQIVLDSSQKLREVLHRMEKPIRFYYNYLPTGFAMALANLGKAEEALEITDLLEDRCSVDAQVDVAAALARANNKGKAIDILQSACKTADAVGSYDGERALIRIIVALAQMGEIEKAIEIDKTIRLLHPDERVEAPAEIAAALIRMNRMDEAYAIMNNLGDSYQRVIIGAALADTGKINEALTVLQRVYDSADEFVRHHHSRHPHDESVIIRKLAKGEIGAALVLAGREQEALKIVRSFQRLARHDAAREEKAKIAVALARTGKAGIAIEVAREIEDQYQKMSVLAQIAAILMRSERGAILRNLLSEIDRYIAGIKTESPLAAISILAQMDPQAISEERIKLMGFFHEQVKKAEVREKQIAAEEAERRRQEAERQRAAENEKILLELGSEDPAVRQNALGAYIERNLHEPRVFPQVDVVIAEILRSNRDRIGEFKAVAEMYDLPLSRALIKRIEEEDALRETIGEKIEEITQDIMEKIGTALGLEIGHSATTSDGNGGSYGSVSLGMGIRLQPRIELKLEVLPGNFLDIETGDTVEEMKERVRVLNFLVHHEVGHLIQEKREIGHPAIGAFSLLDQKKYEHHANEVLIDKLGFETARKIYVHGDGDIVFSEDIREAIAIDAYLTLSRIILRNLESGAHTLSDECQARIVAVLREMTKSSNISAKTRSELAGLADVFRSRITLGQSEEKIAEIDTLIKAYREIFRQTRLD